MGSDEADSRGSGPGETPATRAKKAAERKRLAAALRDNLRRRKAQARGRDAEPGKAGAEKQPE